MKIKKSWIGVIVVVWIVGLIGAYLLATQPPGKNKEEVKELEEKPIEEIDKGISMLDTYSENSLKIERIEVGDRFYYLQISGLKDKDVENKINTRLKEAFEEEQKHVFEKDEYASIAMYPEANFSNILSISLNAYSYLEDEEYEGYQTFNFDLNTGNEISLEDLFNNQSVINSILTREFTRAISSNISSMYEGDTKKKEEEEATIEDQVFTIVQKVRSDGAPFYIANDAIYMESDHYQIEIGIENYGQYFAYPTKYLSQESLYVEDFGLKDVPYVDNSLYTFYVNREYLENGFLDVAIIYDFERKQDSYLSKFEMDKVVDSYISQIPKDSNFYYLNITGDISWSEEYSINSLYLSGQICSMTKEYFESDVKNEIYRQKLDREGALDNLTYFDEDNSHITCQSLDGPREILMNKDGVKFETIEDIFKPGYDYEAILDERLMRSAGYDLDYYQKLKDNLKIQISSDSVILTGGEGYINIPYSEFDRTQFNF